MIFRAILVDSHMSPLRADGWTRVFGPSQKPEVCLTTPRLDHSRSNHIEQELLAHVRRWNCVRTKDHEGAGLHERPARGGMHAAQDVYVCTHIHMYFVGFGRTRFFFSQRLKYAELTTKTWGSCACAWLHFDGIGRPASYLCGLHSA